MRVEYPHLPPRIAGTSVAPPRTTDAPVGLAGPIGLSLTAIVGTVWCAHAFVGPALVALSSAAGGVLGLIRERHAKGVIRSA